MADRFHHDRERVMTVKIDAYGVTDIGKSRKRNDDNFMIVEIKKDINVTHTSLSPDSLGDRIGTRSGHLFMVADGVGGAPEGFRASGATVQAVLKYVGGVIGCFDTVTAAKEHEFFDKLGETVQGVHETLVSSPEFRDQGPATTLTMVLLLWPRAYFVHVGDSRAYVRRGGQLQQLTRDQTFGDYMIQLGAWTEEQASRSVPGARLTSAIGGPELEPSVGLIDLEPGDSMLLCSDGLIRHVNDERIDQVMSENASAETMVTTLLNEALEGGGRDNISIIVMRALES
jgi:protein phosphatase